MKDSDVKLIAFYLPQYHPIPENDLWWGSGFTEWHGVAGAEPCFVGHAQPRLPADLGFYDLRIEEVREKQSVLARDHGVHGFCYYAYWFAGKRLLEKPLDDMVESGRPDFPFCVCWANENWTRRWDGLDNEILMAQDHSVSTDLRFIDDMLPLFEDRRYIRVDGRPLLLVYRADLLSDPAAVADGWRRTCRRAGVGDIYLGAVEFRVRDPRPLGFDALVEFPPHRFPRHEVTAHLPGLVPEFRGHVYDYGAGVADIQPRSCNAFPVLRGVMPSWDNTPRRGRYSHIFFGGSPETYQYWLESVIRETAKRDPTIPRLVFVNAWNEWAEGAVLEPCQRHGTRFLEATRQALSVALQPEPEAESALQESDVVHFRDETGEVAVEWCTNPSESRKNAAWPIVFVSHDAARAGAQKTLLDIIAPFKKIDELEIFILLLEGGELAEEFDDTGHTFNLQWLIEGGLTRGEAIRVVVEDLAERDPLLVACNTVVTGDVAQAFEEAGVPVLSMVWELPTSIGAAFGDDSFMAALSSARRTTVAADFCKRALVRKFDVDPQRLVPLYIGMSCEPETLAERRRTARRRVLDELDLAQDVFLVMGCGSIHHRKGADLFVQAAVEALRSPGSERLFFIWIGALQERSAFLDWCQHDLAAAHLEERVRFIGQRSDPAEYYAASDAFLLPSREDPFPRVVLEAMAHGLPVVAFENAGGAPEALTGGAGEVVPYLDVGAMARATIRLAEAPRHREEMSRRAIERMVSELSPDQLHRKVMKILEDDFGFRLPEESGAGE